MPKLRKATGVEDFAQMATALARLDGSPVYSTELWTWDSDMMAYRHTPMFVGGDIAILLTWDARLGWLFRPDIVDTVYWAPLYAQDDQRNRPDQVLLAMTRIVFCYAEHLVMLKDTVRCFREACRDIGEAQ